MGQNIQGPKNLDIYKRNKILKNYDRDRSIYQFVLWKSIFFRQKQQHSDELKQEHYSLQLVQQQ